MAHSESQLFRLHPDIMWMHDPETLQILAVNDAACARYGYSRAEFLALTTRELRSSDEPFPVPGGGLPDEVSELHRLKDGTLLPVALRAREIEHDGRPVCLAMVRDMSRLVDLEREARETRELLASREVPYRLATRLLQTLQGMSDGLLTVDEHGRFTFVNHEAERLLQRSADQLLGAELFSLLPGAQGTSFERRLRRAVRSGKSAAFEEYFPPLKRWFDVRAYPTGEELVVYFHDVTEERLQRAQLQLLEAAVGRLNDMIMITDAQPLDEPGPRIIYVNDAFVRRTGYQRSDVIGRTPRILQGPATDRAELDRIRAALEAREGVRAELVNYTRDGRAIRVELEVVPLLDASGQPSHWVSVQRDVTEQRELEEKLQRSQRLDAVGQLTGGVAHDFNNLLTVILGNADLLTEELSGDQRLHTLAVMTRTAAERGAELTRRLLAFARRQNLDPSITDVDGLLSGMYGLLSRTLGEHIEIRLHQGDGLWKAMVDAPQLESAVLNLCLNARDAMSEGGRLTLATANQRLDDDSDLHDGEIAPGEYVTITVSDTGTGMPAEIVEHAFEPFFTTKETGKGSGLGLSMVYGFIKQSAGHVKIHSEPRRGTSVVLYLPRAETPTVGQTGAGGGREPEGGSERILVVEDEEIVRTFVAAELESLGYRVVSAADGPQAMEVLKRDGPFDLLFTDVVMPGGMNGRELAEAAQALWPELPVLFTSGYTEDAIVGEGRLQGGVQLLHKPYRRAELAAKVRHALSRGSA